MNKYCINCRHYEAVPISNDIDNFDRCMRKRHVSPVTGKQSWAPGFYCDTQRKVEGENYCGPEGKFFEVRLEVVA